MESSYKHEISIATYRSHISYDTVLSTIFSFEKAIGIPRIHVSSLSLFLPKLFETCIRKENIAAWPG